MSKFEQPKDATFCMIDGEMYRMQYTEMDHFMMQDEATFTDKIVFFDSPEFIECTFYKLVKM